MHHLTLGLHDLDSAKRAVGRHAEPLRALAVLSGRPDDLRDHVAGPLDDHEVALTDVLAVDVLLVVERRRRDRDTTHVDRLELRPGIERAGASDPDVDPLEPGHRRRRSPLEGACPPRALVKRAEAALLVEVVDLDHDAVDLVVELRTPRLPRLGPLGDLLDRLEPLGVRIRAEPVLAKPTQHLPLRLRERTLPHPEAVDPERERALCGHARIELPERAGRRVARVRGWLLACGDLRLVELREAGQREVDLAAYLEPGRRRLTVGDEDRKRHGVDRPE